MEDLKALRKIAEAATPGPWEAVEETSTWMMELGDDPQTECVPCSRGESPIKVETYERGVAGNEHPFKGWINHTHHAEAHQVSPVTGNYDYEDGGILEERDVQFIATFNPETVLALLNRLEQAEQAVARVREVCEHFWPKALHQSVPLGVADSQSQIITGELLRALDGDGRG